MSALALLWLLVFALNVIPVFAPRTWMAMAMLGFAYPDLRRLLVAIVAAMAATCGRLILAKLAQRIVRSRWAHGSMEENLAAVAHTIDRRRAASAVTFHHFGDLGGEIWVWVYFRVNQFLMIGILYLFAKIDWRATFAIRPLRCLLRPLWVKAPPTR